MVEEDALPKLRGRREYGLLFLSIRLGASEYFTISEKSGEKRFHVILLHESLLSTKSHCQKKAYNSVLYICL